MQIEDDAGPRWRWWRILFAALAVPIADLLVITLVVTVYAFKLAFKAQGAPDQARITQFAAQFATSSPVGSWSAEAPTGLHVDSFDRVHSIFGRRRTLQLALGYSFLLASPPAEVDPPDIIVRHISNHLRIPSDADQRSELMPIAIPISCRSPFQSDGDHRSNPRPISSGRV
ncbi:MAG: hypothetical protein A3K18_06985 [Lentisphaerae bacterium RIFOXYA12_64_32]|nr:MAG: hypothetical protein A3K18_06985 [Lentisphaerae bacterium RIFOXYA12_64_32]